LAAGAGGEVFVGTRLRAPFLPDGDAPGALFADAAARGPFLPDTDPVGALFADAGARGAFFPAERGVAGACLLEVLARAGASSCS